MQSGFSGWRRSWLLHLPKPSNAPLISVIFCWDGYGYLLQITLRDEATSSVQDVILTNKEANDAMKVLEEKWSNLVKYKHERQ